MEKKKYVKPSTVVYQLNKPTQLLVGSPFDSGYLPTIPGQHEDEKHLA